MSFAKMKEERGNTPNVIIANARGNEFHVLSFPMENVIIYSEKEINILTSVLIWLGHIAIKLT
jgi:hypothetical protein